MNCAIETIDLWGKRWTVLDENESSGIALAILDSAFYDIPFDIMGGRQWYSSSLRRVLNSDFLDTLDRRQLVRFKKPSSEDYVRILTRHEQAKYQIVDNMWVLNSATYDACSQITTKASRAVRPVIKINIKMLDGVTK